MPRKSGPTAQLRRAALILSAASITALACVEDVDLGQFQEQSASAGSPVGGSAGTTNIGLGGAAATGGAAVDECEEIYCSGNLYACGDCFDNDQDGKADAADSQCLGPCDGTEDSFFSAISGNNTPCRQDCYFDFDNGPGNDQCYWNHSCDEQSVADDYPPSGDDQCAYDPATTTPGTAASCDELMLEQAPECTENCLPLVPNGCDCFGCCELPANSGAFVWIGSTTNGAGSCSEEVLDDPIACRPCTPVDSCFNECGECELCAGRPEPAESCGAPDDNACGDQYQACGRDDQDPCPPGTYCITGCCITIPK